MHDYILAWQVIGICIYRILPYLLFALPVSIIVYKLFRIYNLI